MTQEVVESTFIPDTGVVSPDDVIEEIERFLEHAKPIPLTDQVRIDGDELRRLLQWLREALAEERGR